jgi:hypothetical protein
MINILRYNNQTRQFGVVSALNSPTMTAINNVMGIASNASNMIGQAAAFRDDKYTVIGKGANGKVVSRTLRAMSAMEAIKKAKIKGMNGSKFRAFLIPQQDNEAQDYQDKLENEVRK